MRSAAALLRLLYDVVVSVRACALLANRGPMSVRANSRSLTVAPLAGALLVADGLAFTVADSLSSESDSDCELSSEELLLLLLLLFSDPLEASAVGVPARPKKRL